ncbi:MAG TPA: SsrA-binding protein SmpB [Bacteroidota bacterium]|nr:SsrA-binding protein SmpB [Bacteroidota bacterium]
MTASGSEDKAVATNRKAFHEYFILEEIEAGIALKGTEVKSLRKGDVSFQDSYAAIKKGECWLLALYISPFEKGNINNHDPVRDRRLLLHRREIKRLLSKVSEQGLTLIPLRIYFKKSVAKVSLGLAKGKKLYDKRETIAKREIERELRRKIRQ